MLLSIQKCVYLQGGQDESHQVQKKHSILQFHIPPKHLFPPFILPSFPVNTEQNLYEPSCKLNNLLPAFNSDAHSPFVSFRCYKNCFSIFPSPSCFPQKKVSTQTHDALWWLGQLLSLVGFKYYILGEERRNDTLNLFGLSQALASVSVCVCIPSMSLKYD